MVLLPISLVCFLLVANAHVYGWGRDPEILGAPISYAEEIAAADSVTIFQSRLHVHFGLWPAGSPLRNRTSKEFDQWSWQIEKELSAAFARSGDVISYVPKVISFDKSLYCPGEDVPKVCTTQMGVWANLSIMVDSDQLKKAPKVNAAYLTRITNTNINKSVGTNFTISATKEWKRSSLPTSNDPCKMPFVTVTYKIFFREFHESPPFDAAEFLDKNSKSYETNWKNVNAQLQFGWRQPGIIDMKIRSLKLLDLKLLQEQLTVSGKNRTVFYVGVEMQANFSSDVDLTDFGVTTDAEQRMAQAMFRLKSISFKKKKIDEIYLQSYNINMHQCKKGLSPGAIVAIVLAVVILVAVVIILLALYFLGKCPFGKGNSTAKPEYEHQQKYSNTSANNLPGNYGGGANFS